jgi:hypothetical protein
MTKRERQLISSFSEDLRDVARDLCEIFSLKFSEEVANLSDPLLRWMDFATRYIDPRPRTVIASSAFPKRLPDDIGRALNQMMEKLASGGDVNAYQSRGLTESNDVSASKRQFRTDLLWADWGVHHLHLSTEPMSSGARYSARSDWLLFCLILRNEVGLIDVRPHGKAEAFSEPEIIRQMFKDWPAYMEQYELKGLLPSKHSLDAHTIQALRRGGVNGSLEYKGKVYMPPGGGVTAASTPTRLSLLCDRIVIYVRELARLAADPAGQLEQHLLSSGIQSRDFHLSLTPMGLAVLERESGYAFYLPRGDRSGDGGIAELHDRLLPTWAEKAVAQQRAQSESR